MTVSRRPAAILSTLLLYLGSRVSVDLLLDATWGEAATDSSASTLDTHIWRLRRMLEPEANRSQGFTVLVADRGGFRLLASPTEVDSARFGQLGLEVVDLLATSQYERALDAADRALQLWRGDPYPALADRDWAAAAIARLTELSVQTRERRIDALLGLERTDHALADVSGLLGDHPFRERLWIQRMLALHRSGRSEEALRSFRQVRGLLLDQVGVEPGVELRRLHQQILADDPALHPAATRASQPSRPVPLRLPRRTALIGREFDREAVGRAVMAGRLTTICGPAGCGKTGLAVEVANLRAKDFADGVYFLDLSGTEDGSDVFGQTAEALGLTPPAAGLAAALRGYAQDRQLLMVVDNCEQVIDAVRELCELVVGPAQQFAVLATSREPLDMIDEYAYRLEPLPEEPAMALFIRQARLTEPDEVDVSLIREICVAIDGLPLAVELAAALHPTFTLMEILEQVRRDPGQLAAIGHGQAEHHQTLLAAIDRSYRRLSPVEQRVHRALAVLSASFSTKLAEGVAERLAGDSVPIRPVLARLAHRSMLTASPAEDGGTRFVQLVAVRAHAADALARSGERAVTERARDDWLADQLARRPALGRPDEAAWHAMIAADLPVVRSVLQHRLVIEPAPVAWKAVGRLTGLWWLRGLVDEGLRWAETAVARSADVKAGLSDLDDVRAGLALANLLAFRGDRDRALAAYDNTLSRATRETLGHPETVDSLIGLASAFTLVDYGAVRRVLSDTADSVAALGQLDLEVKLTALQILAQADQRPPATTRHEAEQSYASALAAGNVVAAWWSCSSVNHGALAMRDAGTGLIWSRRMVDLLLRMGMAVPLPQVETYGIFLALSGQWTAAVEVFAARFRETRRQDVAWPRQPLTAEMLAAAQDQLSPADFDRAWAVGPTKSIRDLLLA